MTFQFQKDNRGEAFWMPFTAQKAYPANPRTFVSAKGAYYRTDDGREVLDSTSGLWCVNAGHAQPHIVKAIQDQAERLDFVSSFQMGHPGAFELAARIAALAPGDLDHVFFVNSGSEACDTALKIARACQRIRGQGERTLLVGRSRAYHGVGWGGQSVGGLGKHRRDFSPMLGQAAHLPLPYDPAVSAFSRGQPEHGAHYAEALVDLMVVHDPSTIAAVIVEPVIGSGGVIPPPLGYLQRLRQICDQHGILLIFDEVITGFGRLGVPFAAGYFGVTPDIITIAKGMTNGAVPMGGVIVSDRIYRTFMDRPEPGIEFLHGYTYSGHPLACAAGLATLDVYRDQRLFERAGRMATPWGEGAHGLKEAPHVKDVRNLGLLCGIDLEPRPGAPGARGSEVNQRCFEAGILVRNAGDTLMLSPPFIITQGEIGRVFETIAAVLNSVD